MEKEWIYINIDNLTEFLKAENIIVERKYSMTYVNIPHTPEFKADIAHDVILNVLPNLYRYKFVNSIVLTQGLMELLSNTPQDIVKKYCGDSGGWSIDGTLKKLSNRLVELIQEDI